jgi:hypothetical protein
MVINAIVHAHTTAAVATAIASLVTVNACLACSVFPVISRVHQGHGVQTVNNGATVQWKHLSVVMLRMENASASLAIKAIRAASAVPKASMELDATVVANVVRDSSAM